MGKNAKNFCHVGKRRHCLSTFRQLDDGATKLLPLINLSGYFQTNLFLGIEIVDRVLYSQRGEACIKRLTQIRLYKILLAIFITINTIQQ